MSYNKKEAVADREQDVKISARAGAEKLEQPLRLSCSSFGFLARELREREKRRISY